MQTASRFLFSVLTLSILAASARGQATTTAYSNLKNAINALQLGGATATGGSTDLLADDLTYNASLAGQAVSAFQVQLINYNSTTVSVTPTVIFWNSNGPNGVPGAVLGSYVLPLAAFAGSTEQTLSFTVPVSKQFVLPVSGTIWAGIFVTGTSTTTAAQLNNIAVPIVNPPTTGSSQDRLFESISPGPAAAANPSGAVITSPFGGNPVANLGWELTTTKAGTLENLYSFTGGNDGTAPRGSLLFAADGNYYGATYAGGENGKGTIFQLTPAGALHTIYTFSGTPDGANPGRGLIQGNDGLLYGVAIGGGANGTGTVFKIPPGSSPQVLQVLHSFTALDNNGVNADGGFPGAVPIQGRDGNFYGAAPRGGANGAGTVFRLTPAGSFATVVNFGASAAAPNGPSGPLIEDGSGNFVSTTAAGGASGNGTIYQLTLAGGLSVLDDIPAENFEPNGGVILGPDGNYYGLSLQGGVSDNGTAYLATPGPAGTVTTLFTFGVGTKGTVPSAALFLASDGNLYGNLGTDSVSGNGSIYRLTPGADGTVDFELLFDGTDGSLPIGGVIQGSDGNLYGTTNQGGTATQGNIFRLDTPLPPVVQFNQSEYSVNEFAGSASIRVDRIGGTGSISVAYATSDGSTLPDTNALAGADYQPASGTLVWAAGDLLPKFIPITILDRDVTDGSLHTLTLTLSNPIGSNALGAQTTATLTINDTQTQAPVITSSATAAAQQGVAFSYQIVARNHPTSFSVSGLTDGLSVNTTTGIISGTPTDGGELDLTLNAINGVGTGSAPLTVTIAPSAPVITSAATASGTAGVPFSYQIQANFGPTSYTVTGLTDGLSLDPTTGLISGTPTSAGTLNLTLNAANGAGTGSAPLTVTIAPATPVITSALAASVQAGQPFSYQITATNSPTSFAATGLPAGLGVDTNGLITGTPTVVGNYSVALSATNVTGAGVATLALTVTPIPVPAPVITSAGTASAQDGVAFLYQITASNNPTSFGATGLPAGLSINPATGLIAGTPTVSGSFSVALSVTNAGGTGTARLSLTVTPPPVLAPVITSAATAAAQEAVAFGYQITATNNPTSFAATGLPAGLSINPATGSIAGTPTVSGSFSVALSVTNAGGTGTATLSLSVAPPAVTLTATTPQVVVGSGEIGEFTLTLAQVQDQDLIVNLAIKGTAVNGSDYVLLKTTKKIKAGKTTKPIKVIPQGDLDGASKKTVKLVLEPGTGYTVGTTGNVKVSILAGQ